MGDIRVGDKVFDDLGNICNVTWKSPVWKERPSYRVVTDDGDEIVADQDHEWKARLCGKRPAFKLRTTKTLARSRQKRAMIERQGALNLPHANLLINPYVLGVWLGDGCSCHATITQGDEDRAYIRQRFEDLGYRTTDRSTACTFGVLNLQAGLSYLGILRDKQIPAQYLRASKEQRLALLQGLIDTDGHVAPDGQIEFCSVNRKLAEQTRELVHSLGRKCSLIIGRATIEGKDCGEKYRVMFYMADAASLPRKRERCRDAVKTPHRYVTADFVGWMDTACIEVDSPSHMFLCGRSMLPTHNSEFTSKYFPAYFLGKFPSKRVLFASYEANFASSWGRKVRDLLDTDGERLFGVRIRQDTKAADRWEIAGRGGGMQTTGVGGALTGKGGDLLICDDPVKNSEEANSELVKESLWAWYQTTFYTRGEPNGSIILIQTRWCEDDLAGRVLERAKETGEQWTVINFPAIAEENDILGRSVGDPLWPERYDRQKLEQIKATLTSYQWSALYQQRPAPEGGGHFQRSWFEYYEKIGEGNHIKLAGNNGNSRVFDLSYCRKFLTVDLAFSMKTESDFTVIAVWAVTPDSDLILIDLHRERMTGDKLAPSIKNMMLKYQCDYAGIEDVQAQTLVVQTMRKQGLAVRALKANMDKITRSIPAQIRMESGQVWFPRNMVNLDVLEHELLTFPKGAHDDTVDVLAYAALEVQRLGGAILSEAERERLAKQQSEREWQEKLDRQKRAQADWELERWWLDSPTDSYEGESRLAP